MTAVLNPSLAPSIKALYMFIRFLKPAIKNIAITLKSKKLATNPEYNSTCSFGREEKNHTMPPIIAPIPNSHDTSTLSNSFILCLIHNATMPTRVDINVARSIGKKTSVGLAAPACARYIIMLIGIKQRPDALSTRNIIIASVAVSFLVLRS